MNRWKSNRHILYAWARVEHTRPGHSFKARFGNYDSEGAAT